MRSGAALRHPFAVANWPRNGGSGVSTTFTRIRRIAVCWRRGPAPRGFQPPRQCGRRKESRGQLSGIIHAPAVTRPRATGIAGRTVYDREKAFPNPSHGSFEEIGPGGPDRRLVGLGPACASRHRLFRGWRRSGQDRRSLSRLLSVFVVLRRPPPVPLRPWRCCRLRRNQTSCACAPDPFALMSTLVRPCLPLAERIPPPVPGTGFFAPILFDRNTAGLFFVWRCGCFCWRCRLRARSLRNRPPLSQIFGRQRRDRSSAGNGFHCPCSGAGCLLATILGPACRLAENLLTSYRSCPARGDPARRPSGQRPGLARSAAVFALG